MCLYILAKQKIDLDKFVCMRLLVTLIRACADRAASLITNLTAKRKWLFNDMEDQLTRAIKEKKFEYNARILLKIMYCDIVWLKYGNYLFKN